MQPFILAAVVVLSALAVGEQTRPTPTTPAAILRGLVLTTADNAPLRGARVALYLDADEPLVVFSDASGAFETHIRSVAAGVLRVSKAGYAPSVVPLPIDADGTLRVLLDRGAVLTGRIVDAEGNAVPGTEVAAERLDATREQVAAHAAAFAGRTDERGEFRIGGLPAARYAVRAERRGAPAIVALGSGTTSFVPLQTEGMESPAIQRLQAAVALSPPGSISGVVRDNFGDPLEDVAVRLWERVQVDGRLGLRSAGGAVRTDDRGTYRLLSARKGMYYVAAEVADKWIDGAGTARSYLAEFHPGGPRSAEWTPVETVAGRDVQGIDITFSRAPAPRVSGVVRHTSGGPAAGRVVLVPRGRDTVVRFGSYNKGLGANGTFTFDDVAPGDYVVQATITSPALSSDVREFGIALVAVTASGDQSVVVTTSPVVTVSGRVMLERSEPGASAPRVSVYTSRDADHAGSEFSAPTVSIEPDLSFRVRGLAGPTRFVLHEAPPGWWLKAVNIGGVNAAETPVMFDGGGSRDDISLVLARTAATLTGRVLDSAGAVRDAYSVVVFADDEQQWYAGSARVKTAGAAFADRSFRIHSLPPGDYLVAAIPPTRMEQYSVDWPDYEMLGRLRPLAVRISLREEEQRFVELAFRDLQP